MPWADSSVRLRLPREDRQEVVASLRESGLSTRAIASATGLSQSTVARATESDDSVAEITGLNGKTYAASRPTAEPNPFDGSDWLAHDPTRFCPIRRFWTRRQQRGARPRRAD